MWELWRAHDVFEAGTVLNSSGFPLRALALYLTVRFRRHTNARDCSTANTGNGADANATVPGYPFFSPAQAGHRPPKPPLDTIDDGGLPRHIITGTFVQAPPAQNHLDFSKDLVTAVAQQIAENGTAAEIAAMVYHEQRLHASYTQRRSG